MPLTKEDLKSIGQVIREQVPPLVEGIIEKRVPTIVEAAIREQVPPLVKTAIREQVPDLIEAAIEPHFRAIAEDLGRMEGKIDRFTATADSLSATVRRHEEEWLVLRAQHEKMRDIMVKKGIATEDELALA